MNDAYQFLIEKNILGEFLLILTVVLGFLGYKAVIWYLTKDKPRMLESIQRIGDTLERHQKHFDNQFATQDRKIDTMAQSLTNEITQTRASLDLLRQEKGQMLNQLSDHETRVRKNEIDITKVKVHVNAGTNIG